MRDLLISFRGIRIRNYDTLIFEDLDFDLVKGRHWALVGKSGSGKSTFLDAIAGKASISGGKAGFPFVDEYLHQHPVNDPLFNRFRLISYVSSRHPFRNHSNTSDFYYQQRFNSMDSEDSDTVEEYLSAAAGKQLPGPWTLRRVSERLNLEPLMSKQLIKLSNGETRRLLLAAALIKNPVILLLDNPLTGLDVNARAEFDKLITEVASSGITMIIATSPAEIPTAITDIAILEEGKLRSVSRKEFKPEMLAYVQYSLTDTEELDRLLSIHDMSDYEWIVKMEDVHIRYGGKTILDGINWELRQGERWALTGANGAGKSTLLSLINGDNPQAFANRIILFDRPKGSGESIWDIKRKTGFVSPELFQYFPMDNSCLQVIESGFYDTLGLFRQSSAIKSDICLRWMHLLGIEKYAALLFKNVPVSVQRLSLLARALVKNPPLLIFDEPCQGMDQEQQQRFRSLVDEICSRTKASLIYVSHYEEDMPQCINRRLHLTNGRVIN